MNFCFENGGREKKAKSSERIPVYCYPQKNEYRIGYVTFCDLVFTISNCIVPYITITAYIVDVLFSIPTSEFQFWNYGRRLIICHS